MDYLYNEKIHFPYGDRVDQKARYFRDIVEMLSGILEEDGKLDDVKNEFDCIRTNLNELINSAEDGDRFLSSYEDNEKYLNENVDYLRHLGESIIDHETNLKLIRFY